jgi:hypothetical protein
VIAGIFVRSFQKALDVDPGLDVPHVLTVDLDLREMRYPPGQNAAIFAQVRDGVAGLPGLASASLTDIFPLSGERSVNVPPLGNVAAATVDANYFRAMGIPLLRGREPRTGERNVAVVNEALSRRLWPGEDPIGKPIRVRGSGPIYQVIGMTATGKYWSLTEPPRPFLYQIGGEISDRSACLVIRTLGPSGDAVRRVAQAIQSLNADLPVLPVRTAGDRLRVWLEPQRSGALLLSVLGLAALVLAITGLYALLAQMVAQRTAEIAVRVVLGATRASVLGLLLRRSALLIFAGTALGIAASLVATRVLASAGGPLGTPDAVTLAAVAGLLAAVGAAATIAPAYRALRIAPADALRTE